MLEIETKNVRDFMRALLPTEPHFPGAGWYYRGQADANWGLVPSSRRAQAWNNFGGLELFGLTASDQVVTSCDGDLTAAELAILDTLTQIVERMGLPPHLAVGEARLAFARHIGLPTRLLDWTRSPWTAAYFAASDAANLFGKQGRLAVYAMSTMYLQHSHAMDEIERIPVGAAGNPNLVAQQGVLLRFKGERSDLLAGCEVNSRKLDETPNALDKARVDNQLLRITLPWAQSLPLLELLRRQELHAATVYPGQYGVAQLVREVFLSEKLTESTSSAAAREPAPELVAGLTRCRGRSAQVWDYSAAHSTLRIRLLAPSSSLMALLSMHGCSATTFRPSWQNANLSVRCIGEELELSDGANLNVRCGVASVSRDVDDPADLPAGPLDH